MKTIILGLVDFILFLTTFVIFVVVSGSLFIGLAAFILLSLLSWIARKFGNKILYWYNIKILELF